MKLVVPHSTASLIAGKAGETIARMQKDSLAHIQLQQQTDDGSLQEQIVTVHGKYKPVLLIESVMLGASTFSCRYSTCSSAVLCTLL